MGWGSATDIFDGAVGVAVETARSFANLNDEDFARRVLPGIVSRMYRQVEWDDWDTQDESKYADILNRVRVKYGELDPED